MKPPTPTTNPISQPFHPDREPLQHRSSHGRRFLFRSALFALLIQALALVNAGAAEVAGTVRIMSGTGDFGAVSASNKTLTVAPGASLNGTISLHTTNLGSSGWVAPLIYTPSWGDPSTSWQTINDWISTNPSTYQAAVSVTAPTAPGTYHVIFAYFWEIGADHVASGTNWQLGTNIWDDGDEIARLSAQRIAEAQANGFTVAPHLVPTGSELYNTPADAVTLIVADTQSSQARAILRGPVSGEPAGTTYSWLGTPQVGAFAATIARGNASWSVIVGTDDYVLLRVGGSVPGIAGSVITKLGQPSGDAALVTLGLSTANHITAKNNVVLVRGLSSGFPWVAARMGTKNDALPSNVTIKSFGAIDGNGRDFFFLATLQGNGVTAANATALCVAAGDGGVKVLARVGDRVDGRTIATIGTLVGSAGTLAEGRWRVDETTCGARLTFTDAAKSQAIYAIPATAGSADDWMLLAQTGVVGDIAGIEGTKIGSFGLPGFGPDASAAVLANLAIAAGGPTTTNHYALLAASAGADPILLARSGDPIDADANGAPLTGAKIASMSDPVAGAGGRVACAIMLSRAGLATARAIVTAAAWQTPVLLANVGALAPGGGRWATVGVLALPDDESRGPVFLGTLTVKASDGVTAANNAGLWGVDSSGELRLLLRTGQPLQIGAATKTLKSFTSLVASPGSVGAASTYENAGSIAVLATCTDGTRALITVEIP